MWYAQQLMHGLIEQVIKKWSRNRRSSFRILNRPSNYVTIFICVQINIKNNIYNIINNWVIPVITISHYH